MQHFDYPRQMWRQFFSIWIPLFLTQLSLVAGGFFAATVAGRHSTVDLAGAAVGVNLWVPVLMTSIGLFMGLTPIISQLLGANQPTNIPSIVRQGIYLSLTVGLVTICMGSFLLPWMLDNLGLEPAVRKVTQGFLTFIAYGIIPCFISVT
ncbi:MAG: MATE family efflux transporter, partial [Negativicoccus succinicivorans]|nr:MATE family efflux transporter [Negativicoccus succinicivorans]